MDRRSYLDLAVETAYEAGRLIRAAIREKYPDHAVVGEEFEDEGDEEASHRWILDPIDGTKASTRGVPLYGVLIGLEIEGRCEVGAGVGSSR